jgi:protein phosphatase
VESIDDLKLAPFHIMATEGGLHTNQSHQWHMENIADLCGANPQLLLATQYRWVDLADESSVAAATSWWETMTTAGGEGIVVKPSEFTPIGANGLLQPAVKCRGPEYLRIIYGPEYDRPEYLTRLRQRSLNGKRALALREFALGVEALERFVARAPLRQVHECVFGVLALESEPIDPRL